MSILDIVNIWEIILNRQFNPHNGNNLFEKDHNFIIILYIDTHFRIFNLLQMTEINRHKYSMAFSCFNSVPTTKLFSYFFQNLFYYVILITYKFVQSFYFPHLWWNHSVRRNILHFKQYSKMSIKLTLIIFT